MKKLNLLTLLLLLPGVLLLLVCMSLFFLALSVFPPYISFIALGIIGLIVLWWKFGRRASKEVVNSEAGIMGRQSSKEGLL